MGQAGDQGAAELAFESGFAADRCNEQAHLEQNGSTLQIAQPSGGFRRDFGDHDSLSRKLLIIIWVDSAGELTS